MNQFESLVCKRKDRIVKIMPFCTDVIARSSSDNIC